MNEELIGEYISLDFGARTVVARGSEHRLILLTIPPPPSPPFRLRMYEGTFASTVALPSTTGSKHCGPSITLENVRADT